MSSTTTRPSGWQCPSCRQWIPFGNVHTCGQSSYGQPFDAQAAALHRIAAALERIAAALGEADDE